jgi:hypothetical protein
MTQTPPGNPQWRACNGSYIYGYAPPPPPQTARPHAVPPSLGTNRDYYRRVMGFARTKGIGGWKLGLPYDPTGTWYVTTADDSGETTLTNPPTVQKPPAGVK